MGGLAAVAVAGFVLLGVGTTPAGSATGPTLDVMLGAAPRSRAQEPVEGIWCGTFAQVDRTPNAIAGHPAHWVYAVPSDADDRSAAVADLMQADAQEVDAWWRREDPSRAPRNDLAPFPCGLQLDLSQLRLPQSGAELAGNARFGAIFNALLAAGFDSTLTRYVVYYDGPVADPRICGQGGSDRSGIGLAVVFTRACQGVSTAAVTAHELLHTFGAVPSGAPNECVAPEAGHTCDDPADLMHPRVGRAGLSEKLLDPGRDDYYGHAGGWPDAQDASWLVQLDRQQPFELAITGPGAVRADVPGLACDASCTTTWNDGTRLALIAVPTPGRKLVRWSGACTGAGSCVVTVGQSGPVSALFAPAAYRLAVRISGKGTVRSGRPGITCRPRCATSFPSYVPVRLVAKPAKGWKLRGWSGACAGPRLTCLVPMTRAATAHAVFVRAR